MSYRNLLNNMWPIMPNGYDDFANYQKTHGVIDESVYQSIDDPNDVTVIHDFHSIEEAKAFAASPGPAESMSTLSVKRGALVLFILTFAHQIHQCNISSNDLL